MLEKNYFNFAVTLFVPHVRDVTLTTFSEMFCMSTIVKHGRLFENLISGNIVLKELRNSRVTKSSYQTELHKMTSDFELLTRKFL